MIFIVGNFVIFVIVECTTTECLQYFHVNTTRLAFKPKSLNLRFVRFVTRPELDGMEHSWTVQSIQNITYATPWSTLLQHQIDVPKSLIIVMFTWNILWYSHYNGSAKEIRQHKVLCYQHLKSVAINNWCKNVSV